MGNEPQTRDILELLKDRRNDGFLNHRAAREIERLRGALEQFREAARLVVEEAERVHEWNERNPGAIQWGYVKLSFETADALATLLDPSPADPKGQP